MTDEYIRLYTSEYNKHVDLLNNIIQLYKETRTSYIDIINKYTSNHNTNTDIIDDCLKYWHTMHSQEILRTLIYIKMQNLCNISTDGILSCSYNIQDIFNPFTNLYGAEQSHFGTNAIFGLNGDDKHRNIAILKTITRTIDEIHTLSLVHELTAGLVINNIRTFIPTFMYTYGGIYCNQPIKDKIVDGKIEHTIDKSLLCARGTNIAVMNMSELITGITFKSYIDEIMHKEHLNILSSNDKIQICDTLDDILWQIVLAIETAQRLYGFVHNDLHPGNIILQKIDTIDLQKYKNFTSDHIASKLKSYVVRIIDYGLCSFVYNGITYNPPVAKNIRSNDLTDIHRIVSGKDLDDTLNIEGVLDVLYPNDPNKWSKLKNTGNYYIENRQENMTLIADMMGISTLIIDNITTKQKPRELNLYTTTTDEQMNEIEPVDDSMTSMDEPMLQLPIKLKPMNIDEPENYAPVIELPKKIKLSLNVD